mgnify:CR=1 FL=1
MIVYINMPSHRVVTNKQDVYHDNAVKYLINFSMLRCFVETVDKFLTKNINVQYISILKFPILYYGY